MTFSCNYCAKEFQKQQSLAVHLRLQHQATITEPVCSYCFEPLTTTNWPQRCRNIKHWQCQTCNDHDRKVVQKRRKDRVREETMAAYGGKCACCGESDHRFLTIDHVFNDGAAHRRELRIGFGYQFYKWLQHQGYPQDRFQCLCWNCNHAKFSYGTCPHQDSARNTRTR